MSKIIVSGLTNIETTVKIKEFPIPYFPVDYPFFGVQSSVSGVAYNVAKALQILGNQITFLSMMGKDYDGDKIIQEVSKIQIDPKYLLPILKETPSSVVLFDGDGKRQIYCDLKDAQDQMYETELVPVEDSDLIVACNANFNRKLLKQAKAQNKTLATDVHVLENPQDEYNRDFLEHCHIVFLSDEKIKGDPKKFLKKLIELYPINILVLGQGSKGAMMYVRKDHVFYQMDAVKTGPVVNTIGAGDALFSGFVHFISKGMEPVECLKRAEIFASYKIGFNGAAQGFLTEQELEKICQEKQISCKVLKY